MKVLAVFVALVAVAAAAPRGSAWTLDELTTAIQDPSTDPGLLPYLINALNGYMDSLWNGHQIEAIPVVTPVGIVPSPSDSAVASPVIVDPVVVAEAEAAVVPEVTPAAVAEASSTPLIQIIVNVNSEQVAPAPVATPVIAEEAVAVDPVIVVDQAINRPEPVSVVEEAINHPEPVAVVEVAPEPVAVVDIVPEPVVVAPEVNPIDVIAVAPETNPIDVIAVAAPEANPIDVIAVAAPEVNPVDIMNPVVAVEGASGEGILV